MPHPRYEMAESKIHKSQACGFYRFAAVPMFNPETGRILIVMPAPLGGGLADSGFETAEERLLA